jgi:quinol monooxygenase YgiN
MIVRIFSTAVDPEEIDQGIEIFKSDVVPAFGGFDGCHGVEWFVGLEEHSGDLVDVTAISRWDSVEAIESATAGKDYERALARLRELFRQTPIVHHYRTVD